jgi:Na+/H+ antiporter NhaD/arsenite permease-like protein
VPFEWTLRLIPQWAVACSIVLVVFFIMDTMLYRKEPPAGSGQNNSADPNEEFGIDGKINLVLITGVVLIVFLQGLLIKKVSWWPRFGPQEVGMALLLCASLLVTPYKSKLRRQNGFTFAPIKEVAFLFAGIFAAMIPALYILEHKGAALGITKPWQFFWAAGGLSSFLDNAPTYLTFLSLAKGLNLPNDLGFVLNDGSGLSAAVLAAISCGAVFMGANSYIGNGPNFMVKSIAEEQGVKMPSFFGYMAYSIAILIPTFILITFIFFV